MGSSSITGDEAILFTDNMSFDGTHRSGKMTTDGQLWIGATASNRANNGGHVRLGSITSPLGTLSIGYSSPNITLDIVGGGPAIEHLTADTGGILNPDGANNFNLVGSGSFTTVGAGSTISGTLTGLTNHAVLVGAGTTTITKLAVGSNGQVLIGSTAADPVFGTLTSSDSSITFTTGAGTLSLQVAGGTTSIKTLTGNSGGAISPTAGNINTLGTGSITIAGSGSTLTTQLTGLTNHAIQVGAGTATLTQIAVGSTGQVLQANSAADPTWSTATYPSTTTVNQLLYSSSNNVVAGLATANQGVLTTGSTGIPVITALATNGQLIIGSTAGVPAAATITAGTGITVTNGSNSITIAATGAGFVWVDATSATQAMSVETGYVTDHSATVTYTLPATASLGDEMIIVGKLGTTIIAQNANQQILMSSASSTVGVTGQVAGTNVGDCVTLNCITAGASTVWRAASWVGNWTVS